MNGMRKRLRLILPILFLLPLTCFSQLLKGRVLNEDGRVASGVTVIGGANDQLCLREIAAHHRGAVIGRGVIDDDDLIGQVTYAGVDGFQAALEERAGVPVENNDAEIDHAKTPF